MELTSRKLNRLKKFDYGGNGAYFVTICVQGKHEMLWQSHVGAIINRPHEPNILSGYGLIAENAISNISQYYPCIIVDKYVIMPNHIHMILAVHRHEDSSGRLIIAPTISTVIQQFKRYVSKQFGFSLWQKSFHDHIIRDEQEYEMIWDYIDQNPLIWAEDCYFTTHNPPL